MTLYCRARLSGSKKATREPRGHLGSSFLSAAPEGVRLPRRGGLHTGPAFHPVSRTDSRQAGGQTADKPAGQPPSQAASQPTPEESTI